MVDRPSRERKELKLPAIETKGGRWFTKYNPDIALDIVEQIADGELLSKITAKDAVPLTITKQTFLRWVSSVPELQTAYSAALQLSAHSFEEKAIDKAEKVAATPGTPQNVSAASLLISQYRWSAARRNPTRYSDKGNTQIVVPVNINTTLDMGSNSQSVEVEVPNIYTISIARPDEKKIVEGEFSEVDTGTPENETETPQVQTPREQFREGEFSEVTTNKEPTEEFSETLAASSISTRQALADIIRPDLPTIGTQRQPLLARTGKPTGNPGVPRKRVLTPRVKK